MEPFLNIHRSPMTAELVNVGVYDEEDTIEEENEEEFNDRNITTEYSDFSNIREEVYYEKEDYNKRNGIPSQYFSYKPNDETQIELLTAQLSRAEPGDLETIQNRILEHELVIDNMINDLGGLATFEKDYITKK